MDWSLILFVLLVGVMIFVYKEGGSANVEKLNEAWSEVARQTNMSFEPGNHTLFIYDRKEPIVSGIYRGRQLTLTKYWDTVTNSSEHGGDIITNHTRISLLVTNPANSTLRVKPKNVFDRVFRMRTVPSGGDEFDRNFLAQGSPLEFVRRVLARMVLQQDMLVNRPDGVIMVTDDSFSWTAWGRPSIELKGTCLECLMSGVLTNVGVQIAYLDLLCDLAEMAEETQLRSNTDSPRISTREWRGGSESGGRNG